jgi:hypothetical protein
MYYFTRKNIKKDFRYSFVVENNTAAASSRPVLPLVGLLDDAGPRNDLDPPEPL